MSTVPGSGEYVAISYTPGYMPDDPSVFDSAAQAWGWLANERRDAEDEYDGEYSDAVEAMFNAQNEGVCGVVYGDTPGYDGDHDLGIAYEVLELEGSLLVTGQVDGQITHASAKAVATPYSDPIRPDVIAFTVYGRIPANDSGELWRDLVTWPSTTGASDLYAGADRAERRLLDLLGTYIVARVAAGETGPVQGWTALDVDRKAAPWDVNPDECLTCGGESGLCSCL